MSPPAIKFQEPQSFSFLLDGGLDLTSVQAIKKPGALISGSNVEMIVGRQGYGRIGGFERCTDDTLPSGTLVKIFEITSPTGGAIAVDDLFESGDLTCRALNAIAEPITGDLLTVATHDTEWAVDDVCTGDTVEFTVAAITQNTDHAYIRQAIEQTRDNIPVITGTGTPSGGFRLRGKNYVVRNGVLYRGDAYAWTAIAMPQVMYFEKGVSLPAVGNTITDGTRTAKIRSITVQSGAWNGALPAADQAKGYFTLKDATGTFPVGAVLTVGGVTKATVLTSNADYTLPVGGDYKTRTYNFTNVADADSVYGVTGVGEAFEFDGTDYIPIFFPDFPTTYPYLIDIHQERLHIGFPGGQWVMSVSGQPRVYNALLGSVTYSAGAELVGSRKIHGNALTIFTESSVWLLLGTGVLDDATQIRDWQFIEHDSSIGAISGTVAEKGPAVFISGTEYRVVYPTQDTAGYKSNSIFREIQPLLSNIIENITCSLWCRTKSQYRLFVDNGTAIYATFDAGKPKGGTSVSLPVPVLKAWSTIENSVEKIWFLSTTGYLYRMDSGNTFDDDYMTGSFRVPFFSYGNNRRLKSFPQMVLNFESPVLLTGDTEFTYGVNHAYGDPGYPRPVIESINELGGVGGYFGLNAGYGNFVWGGTIVSEILAYLDGYGPNMSILVVYRTRYDNPFVFLMATVDYIQLGLVGQET